MYDDENFEVAQRERYIDRFDWDRDRDRFRYRIPYPYYIYRPYYPIDNQLWPLLYFLLFPYRRY